ncbi:MAG: hypothetical protein JWQ78_1811 [Sediminibacterium sp.]|nr:hypothetical protein [Sediminibacterium sp.]
MNRILCNLFLPVLAMAVFSCTTYQPLPAARTTPSPDPVSTDGGSGNTSLDNSILANVNAHRRSMGLQSLQMLPAASSQAYIHSRNMATGRTGFGHDGFSQRIAAIEKTLGRSSASAENVAYGSLSAKGVFDVWLNSPSHRKNMEGNYNLTGIGTYKDSRGTTYFTQIFLRR